MWIEPARRIDVLEAGGIPAAQSERFCEQETGAQPGAVGAPAKREKRVEHVWLDRHVEKSAGGDKLKLRTVVPVNDTRPAYQPRGATFVQQQPPEVVTGRVHPQILTCQVP